MSGSTNRLDFIPTQYYHLLATVVFYHLLSACQADFLKKYFFDATLLLPSTYVEPGGAGLP
jgi:hypothetical protein